ncbi:MAG: hypothetical protein RBR24_06745 [Candidatus Carbobacillus sp.]|nr:hypothetical protein [Candidatus Carbobacillus sp.]
MIFNDPFTVERAQTAFSAMWNDHVFYRSLERTLDKGEVDMR